MFVFVGKTTFSYFLKSSKVWKTGNFINLLIYLATLTDFTLKIFLIHVVYIYI